MKKLFQSPILERVEKIFFYFSEYSQNNCDSNLVKDEEPIHWREKFKIGIVRSETDKETINEYIASHKIDRELFYSKYMHSLGEPPQFSSSFDFKIGQKVYVLVSCSIFFSAIIFFWSPSCQAFNHCA